MLCCNLISRNIMSCDRNEFLWFLYFVSLMKGVCTQYNYKTSNVQENVGSDEKRCPFFLGTLSTFMANIREIIKALDNIDHIIQRYAVLETKKLIWGNFQEKVALLTNKTLWGSSYSNLSPGKIPLVLQFECFKKEGNINSKLFSLNPLSNSVFSSREVINPYFPRFIVIFAHGWPVDHQRAQLERDSAVW